MNKSYLKAILGLVIIAVLLIMYYTVPITEAQKLNRQCQTFGQDFLQKHEDIVEKDSKVKFSYSKRTDTCLMSEIDDLGNEYGIYDIKRNYIKQEFDDPRPLGQIFYCDKDGVDSAVLEKVEKYNGKLFHVNYSDFLDNGEGGEPRVIKTPDKVYDRDKCNKLFKQKLIELR